MTCLDLCKRRNINHGQGGPGGRPADVAPGAHARLGLRPHGLIASVAWVAALQRSLSVMLDRKTAEGATLPGFCPEARDILGPDSFDHGEDAPFATFLSGDTPTAKEMGRGWATFKAGFALTAPDLPDLCRLDTGEYLQKRMTHLIHKETRASLESEFQETVTPETGTSRRQSSGRWWRCTWGGPARRAGRTSANRSGGGGRSWTSTGSTCSRPSSPATGSGEATMT